MLGELAPKEPEVHGLVALMEIQASRLRARVDAAGTPILLLDQDRARWDQLLIHRGLAALERAARLNGAQPPAFAQFAIPPGPYVLQAEIAACHARALTADATDWRRIAALYAALVVLMPSPVVELNRAVAVAMVSGPAAGLDMVDSLARAPSLQSYHLLATVRGDLLEKLGRYAEAREEFQRAADLTSNRREQKLLRNRAARCGALTAAVGALPFPGTLR
jgi:predicted RNA polymerase sigma factor